MSKRIDGLACVGLLCLTLSAAAQGQAPATGTAPPDSSAAPSQTTSPAAPSSAPGAKRVWTNDDVTGLPGVSTTAASRPTAAAKPAGTAKPKTKANNSFAEQIAKLQAQIPPIDQKIAELQAALSGKTVDEPRPYRGVQLNDWQTELAQLQTKRADIETHIATLEDQARHQGVPTNSLP